MLECAWTDDPSRPSPTGLAPTDPGPESPWTIKTKTDHDGATKEIWSLAQHQAPGHTPAEVLPAMVSCAAGRHDRPTTDGFFLNLEAIGVVSIESTSPETLGAGGVARAVLMQLRSNCEAEVHLLNTDLGLDHIDHLVQTDPLRLESLLVDRLTHNHDTWDRAPSVFALRSSGHYHGPTVVVVGHGHELQGCSHLLSLARAANIPLVAIALGALSQAWASFLVEPDPDKHAIRFPALGALLPFDHLSWATTDEAAGVTDMIATPTRPLASPPRQVNSDPDQHDDWSDAPVDLGPLDSDSAELGTSGADVDPAFLDLFEHSGIPGWTDDVFDILPSADPSTIADPAHSAAPEQRRNGRGDHPQPAGAGAVNALMVPGSIPDDRRNGGTSRSRDHGWSRALDATGHAGQSGLRLELCGPIRLLWEPHEGDGLLEVPVSHNDGLTTGQLSLLAFLAVYSTGSTGGATTETIATEFWPTHNSDGTPRDVRADTVKARMWELRRALAGFLGEDDTKTILPDAATLQRYKLCDVNCDWNELRTAVTRAEANEVDSPDFTDAALRIASLIRPPGLLTPPPARRARLMFTWTSHIDATAYDTTRRLSTILAQYAAILTARGQYTQALAILATARDASTTYHRDIAAGIVATLLAIDDPDHAEHECRSYEHQLAEPQLIHCERTNPPPGSPRALLNAYIVARHG